jgi:hypothetical protein
LVSIIVHKKRNTTMRMEKVKKLANNAEREAVE